MYISDTVKLKSYRCAMLGARNFTRVVDSKCYCFNKKLYLHVLNYFVCMNTQHLEINFHTVGRVTRITEIPEYYRNTGIPVKNIGIPMKDAY